MAARVRAPQSNWRGGEAPRLADQPSDDFFLAPGHYLRCGTHDSRTFCRCGLSPSVLGLLRGLVRLVHVIRRAQCNIRNGFAGPRIHVVAEPARPAGPPLPADVELVETLIRRRAWIALSFILIPRSGPQVSSQG